MADKLEAFYIEVSAKSGMSVEFLFEVSARQGLSRFRYRTKTRTRRKK